MTPETKKKRTKSQNKATKLREFQKKLTPEKAYRLVNAAIKVRLKEFSLVPQDVDILTILDIPAPW
jgi:hypothetical protein